jgi:hypothetical protein
MEHPQTSIRFRLPVAIGKSLGVAFIVLTGYLISLVCAFVFQQGIENLTGINPAKISIIILLIVLFIPWGVLGWLLLVKATSYGKLNLFEDHLTLSSQQDELLRRYHAHQIAGVKLQNVAFHIAFKDGYRFNCINMGMGKGYIQELAAFTPQLIAFLEKNNVHFEHGRII